MLIFCQPTNPGGTDSSGTGTEVQTNFTASWYKVPITLGVWQWRKRGRDCYFFSIYQVCVYKLRNIITWPSFKVEVKCFDIPRSWKQVSDVCLFVCLFACLLACLFFWQCTIHITWSSISWQYIDFSQHSADYYGNQCNPSLLLLCRLDVPVFCRCDMAACLFFFLV